MTTPCAVAGPVARTGRTPAWHARQTATVPFMNDDVNPQPPAGPVRVPLVRLARPNAGSPALLRIVAAGTPQSGPGRVAVAAFQSSV